MFCIVHYGVLKETATATATKTRTPLQNKTAGTGAEIT